MFYQQGGIVKTNVSQQAQMFVNSHVQQINSIFATFNNAYGVMQQSVQTMGMNGSNHYLHIVGQQDAMHYTITVHVAFNNNGMPIIIESNRGVMNHCPGYGQQYGSQGFVYIAPNNGNFGNQGHGHHHHHGHHGHHGRHH